MILLLTSPNLTFLKGLIQKETVDSDDYDIRWKGHLPKKKIGNRILLTITFTGRNVVIISCSSVQKYFTHFLNSSLL